ncbi:MAG: 50S ribosomal protein L17 [Candidatus Spechtbacteria bacterium SB0662_bin_43]|uniref:Large ribosomal subunit protein bL17 n=1 Tax=Candidatus Spechtbacteria bacterium SB0662_bin_43 TaxID=2604897 RepID=A0A845D9R6_9BACT|nr:50S ribosomal protein L17 [Candidatus Spechtbacteria bacterium SB0662_bin_43]
MRKQVKGRKFGRKRDQRRALMKHLSVALVEHGKIETTEARAKELRPFIERWVTKSRGASSLGTYRLVISALGEPTAQKLRDDIAPRYKERNGGYTRIVKRLPRKGDAAKRAIIEFV